MAVNITLLNRTTFKMIPYQGTVLYISMCETGGGGGGGLRLISHLEELEMRILQFFMI